MALQRDAKYSGRYDAATPAQPQGAFKNRTSPTSQDGSYMEKDWLNDWSAFFSSLLTEAGVTPNNIVDEVGASQYYEAFINVIGQGNEVSPINNSWNGYFDRKHQTQLPSPAGYPATSGDGGTSYNANDEWSLGNYSSGAANTISADDDGVIFSVGTYKLFPFTSEQLAQIDVNKVPIYVVDETGKRHFLSNATTGVNVTKPDATTLKIELTNAIFAELGISKVWRFFATERVGVVPELSPDALIDAALPAISKLASYSDVTASRSLNVMYTNNTAYDIDVIVVFRPTSTATESLSLKIDGVVVVPSFVDISVSGTLTFNCSFKVPYGGTYELEAFNVALISWTELRLP